MKNKNKFIIDKKDFIYKMFLDISKINHLSKEELILREKFHKIFERKYTTSITGSLINTETELINNFVYLKRYSNKILYFLFKENNIVDDDFSKIEFSISKEEMSFLNKNKGISFIIIYNKKDFLILDTKDYFDLFIVKKGNEDFLLTNIYEEYHIGSIFKKISKIFKKIR